MDRPLGVTILSILNAVGGMIFIFAGLSVFIYGDFYVKIVMSQLPHRMLISPYELMLMMKYIAVMSIVGGILGIVIGFGLWIGATWAWWMYMVILILNLISAILTLPRSILGLAIILVVMYYMTRPHVREYFNV